MDLPWERVYEYTWEESDSDENADVKKQGIIAVGNAVEDLRSTTRICEKSVRNGSTSLQSGVSSETW